MDYRDVINCKWEWYWRYEDGEAVCGIYAEIHPGQAWSVCRCPRYMPEAQWREIAASICDQHNAHHLP